MDIKKGRVYIVGAGCGAKDLITVRGLRMLGCCDAVVYDDLINADLISGLSEKTERIYMGKRAGCRSAAQSEINERLIELAEAGKTVVRLKGGDPLVFGRGGEEALALKNAGIAYEIVPGISSCIAVPAEAGIPVTHRGISRSFHVVTAHTKDGEENFPEELKHLAVPVMSGGTIVILMGLKRLREIADLLMKEGVDPEMPAAVVSGENTGHPAEVRGELENIADKSEAAEVTAPAVIIIGKNAAIDLRSQLGPLQGKLIGLTGTDAIQEKLKPGLEALGARVYSAERSVIKDIDVPSSVRHRFLNGGKCWAVLTSRSGVRRFFEVLKAHDIDMRSLANVSFAVIGRSTGEELKKYGIKADFCPAKYTSEGLGSELSEYIKSKESIYLFRSKRGNAELRNILLQSFDVTEVPTYDIVLDEKVKKEAKELLEKTDYFIFSSGSGAEMFYSAFGEVPERATCACIGEVTAAALKGFYDRAFIVAPEISAESLIKVLAEDAAGTLRKL
ncbi:MAG: uroporphyrinogen-III C-methyltransferase [Eubacteriales bacterium]|nr:uroporphyrinogen-III C-methyltransferase [Eubacteriales bacterium]